MGCNLVELGYMRPSRGVLKSDDIFAKDFLNKKLTAVLGNNFIFRLQSEWKAQNTTLFTQASPAQCLNKELTAVLGTTLFSVYIHLHTKRYRCLNCEDHPTTTQHGDWYDSNAHCTKAFAESLLLEMIRSTRRMWPANTESRTTSCVTCLIVMSTPRLIGRRSNNYAT